MIEPPLDAAVTPLVSRLRRVPLREVWRHEAYDFTRWLQENLDVLNDALGLTLISADREQAAGRFSIDLVAEDENGAKIIIENQLERSNHDHLGKLLTYKVNRDAHAAIWIVSEPCDEHVSVISWLNESSSGRFFLVKVEAVRIGDSPAAPFFTKIVGPSASTEEAAVANKRFSERHGIRQAWWTKLVARPDAKLHAHITPSTATWLGANSGVRGLSFNYRVNQDQCSVDLYIDRGEGAETETKLVFDRLEAERAKIEEAFGETLDWRRLDQKRACRIVKALEGGYRLPEEQWEEVQSRQVEAMNRLHAALTPFIRTLRVSTRDNAVAPNEV